MIILSFKTKKDKEHLLEKARKMEEYASMIVECIEDSKYYDEEYDERMYRGNEEDMMDMNDRMMGTMNGRYGYRRRMR